MQNPIKQCLTLFATGLFLWLLWGFWSLGQSVTIFVSVFVLVLTGGMLFWQYKQRRQVLSTEHDYTGAFPADNYQGPVILVCGQSQALFLDDQLHRETSQGWYIRVSAPTELVKLIAALVEYAPSLSGHLSLLYVVLPEQLTQQETLTQALLNWRRAIGEGRQKIGAKLPFWVTVYLSKPHHTDTAMHVDDEHTPWMTLLSHQTEFQVEQEGAMSVPYSVWLPTHFGQSEQSLQFSLWLDTLQSWLNQVLVPQFTLPQAGAPKQIPSAWAIQWIDISSQPSNLWQQFIQEKTTLPLRSSVQTTDLLPLPDVMLRRLHHDISLSRTEKSLGAIGLIFGVFLVGALVGSYHHNQQLIRHIGEDIARFSQLSEVPLAPKLTAYQQLQDDAAELARWEREGIPSAYSLALYQGNRILPYLHTLLGSWAPSQPEITPEAPAAPPQIVTLDSLSLFDVGQYTLKTGATKVLVDALLNIKAKPGWLIMVSGYTDNTGNPEQNQKLSLKRAESVRDWMIQTSDISPTCFAVQGYGQNNPVADNNTADGRARNRRVEIRLIPQAEACQILGVNTVPSMDGGTHSTLKEK
ncbi:OmpA family protein [Providencia sp. JGM181]|uniref:OmpA family protein n=1 Tax=unclassified Providencia TaxID=2633465 RepID=UPI001BA67B33|nr:MULTISPECIES: OmpA family protein [unclassified Providencia]MBS0925476.1 OmpA family protein [Providencia sp. JGM181]MBS0932953.1 OmpA family protein [Providencia sp. JGM172]MBS0997146.1 OmpA family protein [Providencia sp. JGM178]